MLDGTIAEDQRLEKHDALIGLNNRQHMEWIVDQRLSKGRRRSDQGIAVLMFDIDHFKEIVDTYGNDSSDEVLKELARRVRNSVRDDDEVARWGGDEFLVLVSNVTLEHATNLAERIRKFVAATPFPTVGTVTISLGVAKARDDDTASSLFARVDEALHEAKGSGRNCVIARP